MRLLYLNHNVVGTGTFQRAFQLGTAMAARGHEVTVVTTSRSARFHATRRQDGGVSVLEAPDLAWGRGRTGWDPWNAWQRMRLLEGDDFDLIHAFDSRPVVILPALRARRRTGARLFLDWADWWGRGGTIEERSGLLVRKGFGPIETWFEEAFRGRADGSTVISGALEQRARRLGIPREQILRFPNGCTEPASAPADRTAARTRLELSADTPLLLHLGVLSRCDMRLLMEAFGHVRDRLPSTRLVLAGHPGTSPPDDLVAGGAVILTGYIASNELALWLAAADLCVISLCDTTANRGRWPGKVNEYLSAGRPTVMPRVGDAAVVIEEAGAGWVTEPTPAGLSAAVVGALRSPGALAGAGERARQLATEELSWGEMAARVEAFYRATGRPSPSVPYEVEY